MGWVVLTSYCSQDGIANSRLFAESVIIYSNLQEWNALANWIHVLGKKRIHREHTQHEAETLEIIGPIAAMERIFTARKCTGRIGSHWKWSEWLNHPSLRVEPCREAPHWSLLFQSRARLRAGIAQSKKTRKNHVRSTLLTHVRFFLATLYGLFGMFVFLSFWRSWDREFAVSVRIHSLSELLSCELHHKQP